MISRRVVLGGLGAAAVLPGQALRAAGPRVLTAPIALEGGRVLISVAIGGQGPFLFVIDSGGVVGLIRDDAAKRLKLPVLRQSVLGGVGGRGSFPLYRVDDVVIGNAWRQDAIVLAGAGDLGLGRDVIGSLAAGILTSLDTDLDFDAGEVRVYPDGRPPRDGFTRIPSSVEHRGPNGGSAYIFADGVLDGQTFRFVVDTGAPRQLTLFADAARRTRLWDDARAFVPMRKSGLGGVGPLGRTVRADSFSFAGLTLERPLVMLAGPKTGYALEDGIIGLGLLRRLNLSIDVKARALWVRPSRQPGVREEYPLSGLWLERRGDAIVADAVGTASPAAVAGVRAGDRIIGEEFTALIDKLAGPAGARVALTLERDGTRRAVTMELRPYL